MHTIESLLLNIRAEHKRWRETLDGMDEAQICAQRFDMDWSVKDVIAHLHAWQQLSIARLEAALSGGEPRYPDWLGGADPFYADDDAHVDDFNARIFAARRGLPWQDVRRAWEEGCRRVLELAAALPQEALDDPALFSWLRGAPLSAVLEGWVDHHREHLAYLRAGL